MKSYPLTQRLTRSSEAEWEEEPSRTAGGEAGGVGGVLLTHLGDGGGDGGRGCVAADVRTAMQI